MDVKTDLPAAVDESSTTSAGGPKMQTLIHSMPMSTDPSAVGSMSASSGASDGTSSQLLIIFSIWIYNYRSDLLSQNAHCNFS